MKIIKHTGTIEIEKMVGNIIQGDCLSVMKTMPDNCIDLIVTSPPYNLRNSVHGRSGLVNKSKSGKWKNAALSDGYDNFLDDLPYEEYVKWQRECLTEFMRLIKEDGAIFYNNKNRIQNRLLQNRIEIVQGFPLRQIITWKRSGAINFNQTYFLPVTEQIYLICKPKFMLAKGANHYTDVWEITQEHKNPHPAPFPKILSSRIIRSTNAKLVLDPFGGSGTTAISAIENNRNFILIEQSPKYCEMALSRIEGVKAKPVLPMHKKNLKLEI